MPLYGARGAGGRSAMYSFTAPAAGNYTFDTVGSPGYTALAAASNLITTVVGTYMLVVFSLPVSNWLYARLEPLLGRNRKAIVAQHDEKMRAAMATAICPSTLARPCGSPANSGLR